MPIYPYMCGSCSYEFDRLQKISDDVLKVCPECGADSLRRKLTAAAFHLKGTGWYETDFKNKDKKGDGKDVPKGDKKEEATDAKPKTDDKKSDTKSSESKPADTSTSSGTSNSSSKTASPSADSG